jgi:hypothetical protein
MRTPEPSTVRLIALAVIALLAVMLGANALATAGPVSAPLPRGDLNMRVRGPAYLPFN